MIRTTVVIASLALVLAACDQDDPSLGSAATAVSMEAQYPSFNYGSYNLHLQNSLRFEQLVPGADAARGRTLFGLAADSDQEDKSGALFQGPSQEYQGVVVSDNRTCASCHRGASQNFGLPPGPLRDSISDGDALFTAIQADAAGDPDAFDNLNNLGLIKYRPNRFDYVRSEDDPYRQVFFWRKTPHLVNTALQHGFLNDGRGPNIRAADQGAVFAHTQFSDNRFGDLFTEQDAADMAAFQIEDTLSDPRLAALRDPSDPMFETLADQPFYTVPVETDAQRHGQAVFVRNCIACHNTPNVFNNLSNVDPLGGGRSPVNPSFGPSVGRTFDIGVAENNGNHLRFTRYDADGTFHDIVVPLANEDGSINYQTVTFDIGLAASTGRTADIGRFKVPQLRKIKDLAPYFHDNSAATLEDVIDYFNSPAYNGSRDGRLHPIYMTDQDKQDLLQFLLIL